MWLADGLEALSTCSVPGSFTAMDDETHLVASQWRNGLRISHLAHERCAARFADRNRWLGVPAVLLATVAGGSGLSTLQATDAWVSWVAGFSGIGAAALASAQTFLDYEARAEQHRRFASAYGDLRRRLDLLLAIESDESRAVLEQVRAAWDTLNREAPSTPDRIHKAAKKDVPRATRRTAASEQPTSGPQGQAEAVPEGQAKRLSGSD